MRNKESYVELLALVDSCRREESRVGEHFGDRRAQVQAHYEPLRKEIDDFCGSASFLSMMKVLCRINEGKLLFSPSARRISFMGREPRPHPFDRGSCQAVKDEAKRMMLAVRSGNPKDERVIASFCVGYATMIKIHDTIPQYIEEELCELDLRDRRSSESAGAKLRELSGRAAQARNLANDPPFGIFIGSRRPSLDAQTLRHLREEYSVTDEEMDDKIILNDMHPYELGSVFVHSNEEDRTSVRFHDFINGIFYHNFLKYQVGEMQIACIENTEQSTLPLFELNGRLINRNEREADLKAFSRGPVAGDEEQTAKLLSELTGELTRRKSVFGQMGCRNVHDYNAKNKYNKCPNILLMVSGYPETVADERSFRALQMLMKDGVNYGMFVAVFGKNTPITSGYGVELKLDLEQIGAFEIDFSDPSFVPVEATVAEVNDIRVRAASELKQSEVLYLDELLENELSLSYFAKEMTIPIGLCDGNIYYFASSVDGSKAKYNSSPFTLVIGSTGKGKSAFLHTLILSGASCYPPDELQFYIVDFKSKNDSAEFSPYLYKEGEENLYIPHVRYLSMKSKPENVYDVLDMINNLANQRAALFSSVNVKDLSAYNSSPAVRARIEKGELPKVPQIYFLIDEYITMLSGGVDGDSSDKSEIESRFLSILTRLRTSGVGIIFSGQKCVFNAGTMGQIGNRIAFDTGDEKLLSPMFTFSYTAGDDSAALYGRLAGKIGYAASVRSAGDTNKSVVRTAFSGSHMGERQRAIAKRIREKYSDPKYYARQIVPGEDVMENADSFLKEECARPVTEAELIMQSADTNLNVPLHIGVSSMTSTPIPYRFCLQKAHGGVVLAKEAKQRKIEANIALSFLRYLAVNGGAGDTRPKVVLCERSERKYITSATGKRIEVGEALAHPLTVGLGAHELSHLITHHTSATATAEAILEMNELRKKRFAARSGADCDRSTYLLILHDAAWLTNLESYLEAERTAEEEEQKKKAEERVAAAPASSLAGWMPPPELAARLSARSGIRNSILANMRSSAPVEEKAPEVKEKRRITAHEVMTALSALMQEGNLQNILVVLCASSVDVIEKATGIRTSQKGELDKFGPVAYGSDDVRKSRSVEKDENRDTCFVMPQELKVRLYDTSSAATEWWHELEELYGNNNR